MSSRSGRFITEERVLGTLRVGMKMKISCHCRESISDCSMVHPRSLVTILTQLPQLLMALTYRLLVSCRLQKWSRSPQVRHARSKWLQSIVPTLSEASDCHFCLRWSKKKETRRYHILLNMTITLLPFGSFKHKQSIHSRNAVWKNIQEFPGRTNLLSFHYISSDTTRTAQKTQRPTILWLRVYSLLRERVYRLF
jgi:hypothetical protein